MKASVALIALAASLGLVAAAIAAAIAFGGPRQPEVMASINDPFRSVDHSDLPPEHTFAANDGTPLVYRHYPARADTKASAVLIHGSSASSRSMHMLAKAFADADFSVYALDVRGHGASAQRGHIDYVGQLEDDLDAFVRHVAPPRPMTLVGFSSGGGLALRVAGSARQNQFDNYLLLAPFISQNAPNYRPNSGGWVSVGLARIVAIATLHAAGIRAFNHLPVINHALPKDPPAFLTPAYSYALAMNFRPQHDYEANIRAAHQPVAVVAGADDESFDSLKLAGLFSQLGKDWPVTIVPGTNHIGLTLDGQALRTVVTAANRLRLKSENAPAPTRGQDR